jgi:dipeptidyl aminopeptidase/acylaminoacyl peptidase
MILFCPYMNLQSKAKTLGIDDEMAVRISPGKHVKKGNPPALIIVGSQDQLHRNLTYVSGKMKRIGNRADLFTVRNARHGLPNLWNAATAKQIDQFLKSIKFVTTQAR